MRAGAVVALISLVFGCGTPGEPSLPAVGTAPPQIFAVLDPDSATQAVAIRRPSFEPPGPISGELRDLSGPGAGTLLAVGVEDRDACQRYGPPGECLRFHARVVPGGRYRVAVSVNGRVASGDAEVPGDFRLDSVQVHGTPQGATSFSARWTASLGGFRYAVNVAIMPPCGGCLAIGPAWGTTTAALAVDTVIPIEELPAYRLDDSVHVSVAAMSRPLVDFLASGAGGFYPIAPKQNVVGGYGVVGGWVRRLVVIPPVAAR